MAQKLLLPLPKLCKTEHKVQWHLVNAKQQWCLLMVLEWRS